MNRLLAILVMSLTLSWAQDIQVSYLSAEYVYLNAGIQAGLAQGDIVRLVQNPSTELEVLYSSQFSSSCRLLTSGQAPKAGDLVFIKKKSLPTETPTIPVPDKVPVASPRSDMKINGYVSAYANTLMSDTSSQHLYGQGIRLNVKSMAGIRDLGGVFRGTDRNIDDAHLSFMPKDGAKFKVGRFAPQDVYYLGSIDGAQTIIPLSSGWVMGGIAGLTTQPDYVSLAKTQKISVYSKWNHVSADRYSSSMIGVLHESDPSNNNINDVFFNTSLPNIMGWGLNGSTLYGNTQDGGSPVFKQSNVDGTLRLSQSLQTGFNSWYDASSIPYYGLRIYGQIKDTLSQLELSTQVNHSSSSNSTLFSVAYQCKNLLIAPSMFNARWDGTWGDDYVAYSCSAGLSSHCFSIHDVSIRILSYYYKHTVTDASSFNPSLQITDELSLFSIWDISISAERYFGDNAPANSINLNSTLYF